MLIISPAGAVGPGTGDIATPPVRPSVRLSHLVFALYLKNALLYFLETLQVHAPSDGGVLYRILMEMLFEFFMNFLNIEKNKISSKFHVFFAFHAISMSMKIKKKKLKKKNWCKKIWCKKNLGGGGVKKIFFF